MAKPSDMFYGYNNNHAHGGGGGASVSGQPDDMVQSWIASLPALQDLSQVKSKATPPERSDSFSAPTSGSGSPVVVGGGRRALAFSKLSVVVPATCTNITRDQEDIIELKEEEANFLAAARGEVGAPAGQEQPKGGVASKSPRAHCSVCLLHQPTNPVCIIRSKTDDDGQKRKENQPGWAGCPDETECR